MEGLVIDGSKDNIDYIQSDVISWSNTLSSVCRFITAENIDDIIESAGFSGKLGILSIDVDGNDYWIWQAISCCDPSIVICEYNSHFGCDFSLTTPYDPEFVRDHAHYSKIYYGASIMALYNLAQSRGYSLVAGNNAGNNLFFVRSDLLGDIKPKSPSDVYRESRFREAHDVDGRLNFLILNHVFN